MASSNPTSLGLAKPVHDPKNPVMDIVLVHGLGGEREATWTMGKVFWPKDLLAADIPDARISSFGYDSHIVQFWSRASQNKIKDHADNLSAALVGLRTEDAKPNRPIIFVAHSLGGLVCAQALITAGNSQESHTHAISDSTKRIAFLGTPHHGSDKAKLAETGRLFLDYFRVSSSGILKDLAEGSDCLATLGDEFHQWLRGHSGEVEVVSFFEDTSTKFLGKIVVPEAACLQGHPKQAIHADHTTMCKYSGKNDSSYQMVSDVLIQWAKELREAQSAKLVNDDPTYSSTTSFSGTSSGMQVGQQVNHGSHSGSFSATYAAPSK